MRPPHRGNREAYVSAPSKAAQANAWFSQAHAHARWTSSSQAPTAQGATSPYSDRVQEIVRPQGFPKSARLLRRRDFSQTRRGRRFEGRHFIAYVLLRRDDGARLGLAVSTKVGHAVTRNRIRRLAREAFRRLRAELGAMDVLLVARRSAAQASYADVKRDLFGACGL